MQLAALWSARSEHAEPAATRPGAGTSGDIWSRHAIPEMAVSHRLDSTLEQRWTLAQGWLDDVKSRVTRTLLQRHAKLNRWIFSSICSSRVTNAELKEKSKIYATCTPILCRARNRNPDASTKEMQYEDMIMHARRGRPSARNQRCFFASAQEKAGSLFDQGYRCMVHLLRAASSSGRSFSAWAASA